MAIVKRATRISGNLKRLKLIGFDGSVTH